MRLRREGVPVGRGYVRRIREEEEQIVVEATPTAAASRCPGCGARSERVHSTYRSPLRDLPACGRPVHGRLQVRRFFCDTVTCGRRTFVEQIAGTTERCRRATGRRELVLAARGVAVGGEAGARLAGRIGTAVTGDTLVRLLMREPVMVERAPRVLGGDAWAWRRGRRYGSVRVALEARRPVDLLPDRTAATLAQWLEDQSGVVCRDGGRSGTAATLAQWLADQPGAEVIGRDRSTEYARGAALGAPAAIQGLDRGHVLRNVREVAERRLDRQRQQLRPLVVDEDAADVPRRRSAAEADRRHAVRPHMAERHAEIQRLAKAGERSAGTARRLRLTRTTVRRYLATSTPPERSSARQPSVLDQHEAYLRQRWAPGCHKALQLWRELCERGYRGTARPVARWAAAQRTAPAPTTPRCHRGADAEVAPARTSPSVGAATGMAAGP
jgi:transposase